MAQECPTPPPRRGPRQIDIVRAIRGAEAGGLRVTRIEIDGARAALFTESARPPAARGPRNVSLRILGASSQAGQWRMHKPAKGVDHSRTGLRLAAIPKHSKEWPSAAKTGMMALLEISENASWLPEQ
jgi:hypothetical protein